MVKSIFSILTVAAVGGLVLVPGLALAATAAPAGPAVLARSSTPPVNDPDTTTTFTVSSGDLTMTAPDSVSLGTNGPDTVISGELGVVQVTDNRALLAAAWTVTAGSTDWTTGGGTPEETIPAGNATYDPGAVTPTGTILIASAPITLANTPADVVAGSEGTGDNAATWIPTLTIAIPTSAISGVYTGTLTEAVS